jgi:hypothetical protein
MFLNPPLTRARMRLAIIAAVVADALQLALQLLLGPIAAVGPVQVIDVVAMLFTMATLGFHFLLLPTFVIEFIPLLDMAPTWTGCVLAVIALRRRGQKSNEMSIPPKLPTTPKRLDDERK